MESLNKFNSFVSEIKAENGAKYKSKILEKYKDDEDVKKYLSFIFNPYIVTGISSKKLNKTVKIPVVEMHSVNMDFILNHLTDHNTGTDEDIGLVQAIRDYIVYPEQKELYNAIVTKNLPIGVDTKTINKVIPGLIPEFNVMLAEKYFEKPEKIVGKDFIITTKIDGGRIIALKENGKVSFYTRQGQAYEGLVDLEKEMQFLPDNICLDGEITLLDSGNLTSKEQYKQTMKITRSDGEKHNLRMLVFDCMPAEDFRNQKCDIPYYKRRATLEQLIKQAPFQCGGTDYTCRHYYTFFKVLPVLYKGNDVSKISEILDEQLGFGEEGIMLNVLDAPYDFKRTWNLQKVKKFQSCDLKVVGFEEGINKLSGTLGAVLLEYKNNIVKCGSGFTDAQRSEIWNNKDKYVNTIFEISYFEETKSADDIPSLRFPTFVDFRPDKSEPNY